jgi:hypothetical protein
MFTPTMLLIVLIAAMPSAQPRIAAAAAGPGRYYKVA